ncbi:filamentous hemagglutinin N-terminal domain-containing protein [Nostoc sp. FACHB-87]|uniref:two-partner secretion domain-containing protein n=1 Tax=Nostocales TaxID=1161 RepID=UPI001684C022|nr:MULTISPECIES: filamentous hemagglutinin N-terminal domain-containing protein [Nostocales]MBD2303497.1 filamentous hemagglutinin N-terminal domain-containing protein [Nostoc sp. FACHB-190]MBD2458750.1 filamentous hemagglutinin N-terminal domain-containing protein [Nostoc sp. FACHB-87]MBD2479789.1 filamentous hemagglutinin N-terminal domain-containing protein [Anabaena sp. FACHB-83]MBD2492158.1 filamentous hemagglutinin N-terminal domain-containing protein [Aulosira sp. FACHB-615]
MLYLKYNLFFLKVIITLGCLILNDLTCYSQIIPDSTLPNNTSIKINNNTIFIENGTKLGENLFHSFKDFSVSNRSQAYFNNSLDVKNIISRVTGSSVSNIDGLIRANGTANIFLINPNGVIFGQNAQLNIGGSFIGSTANSIKFADGFEFTANKHQATPILTISSPIGLLFGSNPKAINVEGTGHDLTGSRFSPVLGRSSSTGLQVQPTRTIALVGGNLILNGGKIIAEGGRVELGSVGNHSLVNLTQTSSGWNLSYDNTVSFQDIQLLKRSLVDTSGIISGSIYLQGQNITLTDGSVILIQNQGSIAGGTINIHASNSLDINGTDPIARIAGSLRNETLGLGKAGDSTISTRTLILRDGGQINSLTFSSANSGDVVVKASDSVNVVGVSPRNSALFSLISSGTFSSGDSGNIVISAQRLIATGGGAIGASTFGSGRGGDLTINATDVMVEGYAPDTFQPSVLSATAFNTGNAGNLEINTASLLVQEGGRTDSSTFASGDSGSITINASKSINIDATLNSLNPSLVISSAKVESQVLRNLFRLPPVPSGNSGNIIINTPVLNVTGNALITVRNEGIGNAGNININANRINISNGGGISATTAIAEGGNIGIESKLVQLNNGNISATAGQQGTNGNGGNIRINADVIAGFNNSRITADAFQGRGGNIRINTQGLFLSPNSLVTASSQQGIDGNVETNVSRTQSPLVNAQLELPKSTPEIASVCPGKAGAENRFVITGKGGLPSSPLESAYINPTWQPRVSNTASTINNLDEPKLSTTKIIPAQGWQFNNDGTVTLVAQANTTVNTAFSEPTCHTKISVTQ